MGQSAQRLYVSDWHGGAAYAIEKAGVRGQQHKVGTDAVGTLRLGVQEPHEDSYNRQNHNHFNGHGKHTDDGAQGAMQQVREDQFIHFGTQIGNPGPKSAALRVTVRSREPLWTRNCLLKHTLRW